MNGGYIFLIIFVIILSICGAIFLFMRYRKSENLAELSKVESEINRLENEYYEKTETEMPKSLRNAYYSVPLKELKNL